MGTNSGANRKHEVAFEQFTQRLGGTLIRTERILEGLDNEDCIVTSLRVRTPGYTYSDYLVTIKAEIEGVPHVGFHGATTFGEAIQGAIERLQNRTMKWKADQYAK
jgi:hypothetical protein